MDPDHSFSLQCVPAKLTILQTIIQIPWEHLQSFSQNFGCPLLAEARIIYYKPYTILTYKDLNKSSIRAHNNLFSHTTHTQLSISNIKDKMQYSMNLIILAYAALATAESNMVTFMSMDSTDRTIIWTPSPGNPEIDDTIVPGNQNVTITIPENYLGNAYSVSTGGDLGVPGMLAEFAFNSYAGANYFDVSAIVNADDTNGVYQMFGADMQGPISGCQQFPCNNAYYLPDDIQTKSTNYHEIVVTLGAGPFDISSPDVQARSIQNFPHDVMVGKPDVSSRIKARMADALRWANRL